MQTLLHAIETSHPLLAWLVLAVTLAILAKAADMFVESSVALAERFHVPKLVIGIVLVSFATTAPELSVSMMSALAKSPEMALGNAVGSVICNCGLALALCGILSAKPIPVMPGVMRTTGCFLLGVSILTLLFVVRDHSLTRPEGLILVLLFGGYLALLLWQHAKGGPTEEMPLEGLEDDTGMPMPRLIIIFAVALGAIILSSRFVIVSATTIAHGIGVPDSVIALTLVALGTSVPEVATSVMAALKGQGELSVGNILGANIMNICWVAGASSIANPLGLSGPEIFFMFPAMLVMVVVTLGVLGTQHSLNRRKGWMLLALYILYLASFLVMLPFLR